jgi:hypothetical protein
VCVVGISGTMSIYLCIFVFVCFLAHVACCLWCREEYLVYCVERLRNKKILPWSSMPSFCSVLFLKFSCGGIILEYSTEVRHWDIYRQILQYLCRRMTAIFMLRHDFGIFYVYWSIALEYLFCVLTLGYY